MEPRIQYARTKDGVSIAFYTLGEGTPFVHMPNMPWTHIQLERQSAERPRWFELVAGKRKHIGYDARGSGMSDRDVADYSLDAHLQDLEAVVHRQGLERFALFAPFLAGPVAIAYAARHPQRVSHLILFNSLARVSDLLEAPQAQGLEALMNKDWELFTETMAHYLLGWSAGESARYFAALMRESVTQKAAQAVIGAAREIDVRELLAKVKAPTLVLHSRQIAVPELSVARGIASGIPDASLVVLDDAAAVDRAIDDFLGEGEEASATSDLPEGMAVILFADIVESTALTEQLGDAAFRNKARELDTSLRAIIRECAGTPVEGKLVGDGVLAVFTSARQAIECALRCNANSEPLELQLHLGIHAGDVIREGNNIYGGAVNIAARIAGASAPGEVLVSDTVRSLARTSAGVAFDDRGEQSLKGVADPQHLFAVQGGGG